MAVRVNQTTRTERGGAGVHFAPGPRKVALRLHACPYPPPRARGRGNAALIVDELGPNAFEYTLQVGTNRRLAYQSSPFPTEGIRRLLYQSRLTQAISTGPVRQQPSSGVARCD